MHWRRSALIVGAVTVSGVFATTVMPAASATKTTLRLEAGLSSGAAVPGMGSIRVSSPKRTCKTVCDVAVDSGATVTLRAVAGKEFEFDRWSDASVCEESDTAATGVCTVTVPEAGLEILALFRAKTYTLQVIPLGDATISSGGNGIDCSAGSERFSRTACAAVFAAGARVDLTVVPDPGTRFVAWSVAGCPGTTPTCSIRVRSDLTVTASLDPVRIALHKSGAGTVTSVPPGLECGADCIATSALFPRGSVVKLAATQDPGGPEFKRWGDPCAGSVPVCELPVIGPQQVSAAFGEIAPRAPNPGTAYAAAPPSASSASYGITVTVRKAGKGKGTIHATAPSGHQPIVCGSRCAAKGYRLNDKMTIEAKAAKKGKFVRWAKGCAPRTKRRCTVYAHSHTEITATFKKKKG